MSDRALLAVGFDKVLGRKCRHVHGDVPPAVDTVADHGVVNLVGEHVDGVVPDPLPRF